MHILAIYPDGTHNTFYDEESPKDWIAEQVGTPAPYRIKLAEDLAMGINAVRTGDGPPPPSNTLAAALVAEFDPSKAKEITGAVVLHGGPNPDTEEWSGLRQDQIQALSTALMIFEAQQRRGLPLRLSEAEREELVSHFEIPRPVLSADSVVEEKEPEPEEKSNAGWIIGIIAALLLGVLGTALVFSALQPEDDPDVIDAELIEREEELDEREAELDTREEDVETRETEVEDDAEENETTRQNLSSRESELDEREEDLDEREEDIGPREEDVEDREDDVEERESAASTRESELDEREEELDEREAALENQENEADQEDTGE